MAMSGKWWAIMDSQGAKRRNSKRSTAHRERHTIRPPSLRCQKGQAKRRSLVFSLKNKSGQASWQRPENGEAAAI